MTGASGTTAVRLAVWIGGLSLACDAGAATPPGASLRTALAAVHLARAIGLRGAEVRNALYVALLRYVGCSGFAPEEARSNGGDDLGFLRGFEDVDPTRLPSVVGRGLAMLGRGQSLATRTRLVLAMLGDPRAYAKLARAHCEQAVALASELRMSSAITSALGQAYERFDGRGEPHHLRGEQLSTSARLLHVANAIEVHLRHGGPSAVVELVTRERGRAFDPNVAQAFLDAPAPLMARMLGDPWDELLDAEPTPHEVVSPDRLDDVALAFARYVDLKSVHTLSHSTEVGRISEAAARTLGLGLEDVALARRAGWLHDLGRSAISNAIWDKPGPLSTLEREEMRTHVAHGERMLARAAVLDPIRRVQVAHHERADGRGYPAGSRDDAVVARIVAAADVFAALGEERPHRPAMERAAAATTLADEVREGRLGRDAVEAILGAGLPATTETYPSGLTEREAHVLRELARGRTNKEIGAALGISPRTVQVHLAHVFDKTGCRTRSAAALFAVTRGIARLGPSGTG